MVSFSFKKCIFFKFLHFFKKLFKKNILFVGLNPQWNKEFSFDVESTDLPLVFLRFRVYHRMKYGRPNRLVGQRMVAFDSLAEGYRNVALKDVRNRPLEHAKLVVTVEKDWTHWREMYGPTKL